MGQKIVTDWANGQLSRSIGQLSLFMLAKSSNFAAQFRDI